MVSKFDTPLIEVIIGPPDLQMKRTREDLKNIEKIVKYIIKSFIRMNILLFKNYNILR